MIKGYKGLKKDQTCKGIFFPTGERIIHSGNIKLCEKGFHFCEKLEDVFNYYPKHKSHIYAEVEIPDTAQVLKDPNENKSVTNVIKIVKILSDEEIRNILTQSMYDRAVKIVKEKYIPIQKRYPDTVCLGGSLSLILQGYTLTYRTNLDMDIVIPYYMNMKEMLFNSGVLKENEQNSSINILGDEIDCELKDEEDIMISGSDVSSKFIVDGFKFENFISSSFKHKCIKIDSGEIIKVISPVEIWEAKIRYAIQSPGRSGRKHINDILEAFNNI